MSVFRLAKVVSTLPGTLTADTLYLVRTGAGFDFYVSDSTGSVAHALNGGVVEGASTFTDTEFTATEGQTSFSATYTVGTVEVFVNGVLLGSADYTATSGTAVVLASGATAGDLVTVRAYAFTSEATLFTDVAFTGSIEEEVFEISGTTPALDPANGTIQTWTLTANSTPTDSLSSGESITLMINDGFFRTITWPTMKWAGGSAPTLATSGYSVVELWKVGSTLYGASVGDMS